MEKKKRLRPNYKTGDCEECGTHQMRRNRFRGKWLCDDCLLGDMEPLYLENYVYQNSLIEKGQQFGDSEQLGVSTGTQFYHQLTEAMQREGWLKGKEQMKREMFYRK